MIDYMSMMALGFFLAAVYVAAIAAAHAWTYVAYWADDKDSPRKPNPIIRLLMACSGYKYDGSLHGDGYRNESKNDSSDGQLALALGFLVSLVGPTAVFFAVKFYPVVIAAVTIWLIAHVWRFAKRQSKILSRHMGDKDAHK